MLKKTEGSEKAATIIGPGTKVEGTVSTNGMIRVDGAVEGKIITPGEVIIGQEGQVAADIEAGNLIIAGKVTGNVFVKKRLEIKQGGSLKGDLAAGKIVMEEGALFDGKCSMKTENKNGEEKKAR